MYIRYLRKAHNMTHLHLGGFTFRFSAKVSDYIKQVWVKNLIFNCLTLGLWSILGFGAARSATWVDSKVELLEHIDSSHITGNLAGTCKTSPRFMQKGRTKTTESRMKGVIWSIKYLALVQQICSSPPPPPPPPLRRRLVLAHPRWGQNSFDRRRTRDDLAELQHVAEEKHAALASRLKFK